MPQFELTVNGKKHALKVEAAMPLLWVLRDFLGLTGTKYGCGIGQCGSCMVHLDGEATRSCLLTVADAVGKRVTTIEGLAAAGEHPVQTAWKEERVPQCGFCQAGQIMSAAALLAANPKPDSKEIAEAMDGNLCRCGTYGRIRKAIDRAAAKGGQS